MQTLNFQALNLKIPNSKEPDFHLFFPFSVLVCCFGSKDEWSSPARLIITYLQFTVSFDLESARPYSPEPLLEVIPYLFLSSGFVPLLRSSSLFLLLEVVCEVAAERSVLELPPALRRGLGLRGSIRGFAWGS